MSAAVEAHRQSFSCNWEACRTRKAEDAGDTRKGLRSEDLSYIESEGEAFRWCRGALLFLASRDCGFEVW